MRGDMKDNKYIELMLTSIFFIASLQVFAVLAKLKGYIDWSWWWVLSPIWIAPTLTIVWVLCISFVEVWKDKSRSKEI